MKDFLYKNNLKKVTKKFNETTRDWQKDSIIELTGFFNEDDQCQSGRNGMNTVCRLLTKRYEYSSIYFKRSYSETLKIYFNSPVREWNIKSDIYIEIKNNKNIAHLSLPERFDSYKDAEKWVVDTFRRVMSYSQSVSGLDKIVSSLMYSFHKYDIDNPETKNAFVKLLRAKFNIGETFTYNNELSIWDIKSIKETANILTIIYKQNSTYESRIFELKIKKPTKTKFVRLSTIGGELPGYYNHSERLNIHQDDVKAAKSFIKRVYNK